MKWTEIQNAIDSHEEIDILTFITGDNFLSSGDKVLIKTLVFLRKKEKLDACEKLIEQLERRFKGDSFVTLLFIKGDVHLDKDEFQRAIECYTEIIKIGSLYLDRAYNNRGLAYWYAKNNEAALSDYRTAIEINPKNSTALKVAGEIYMEIGKLDESIAHLKRAVQAKPDYDDAWVSLGTAFSLKDDPVRSYKCFLTAIKVNPENKIAQKGIDSIEKMYDVKADPKLQ